MFAPAAFSSARRIVETEPLTSLSRPRRLRGALAHVQSDQECQDCFLGSSREGAAYSAIRDAFPRQVSAPSSRVPFPTSSFSANVREIRDFAATTRFSSSLRPQTLSLPLLRAIAQHSCELGLVRTLWSLG